MTKLPNIILIMAFACLLVFNASIVGVILGLKIPELRDKATPFPHLDENFMFFNYCSHLILLVVIAPFIFSFKIIKRNSNPKFINRDFIERAAFSGSIAFIITVLLSILSKLYTQFDYEFAGVGLGFLSGAYALIGLLFRNYQSFDNIGALVIFKIFSANSTFRFTYLLYISVFIGIGLAMLHDAIRTS